MDYEVLTNGKIQLGGKAPEFSCNSTCGEVKFPMDNVWTVMFSYKEDFYSVATSEIIFLERNLNKNKIVKIHTPIKKTSILELPNGTSSSLSLGDILFFEFEDVV